MLTGKYAAFAEYFGNDVAEGIFRADISTAKKKDRIRRLKEKLLELPAADVGTAYKKRPCVGNRQRKSHDHGKRMESRKNNLSNPDFRNGDLSEWQRIRKDFGG